MIAALKASHPYEEVAYDLVVLENNDASIGLGVKGHLDRGVSLGAFAQSARKALGARFVASSARSIRGCTAWA